MVRFNKSILRLKLPSSSSIQKQNQREPKNCSQPSWGLDMGTRSGLQLKGACFTNARVREVDQMALLPDQRSPDLVTRDCLMWEKPAGRHNSLFFKKFSLQLSCFPMLCQFLLHSQVNQLHVHAYPLSFGFPSQLGHHRKLSRVLCAIQ